MFNSSDNNILFLWEYIEHKWWKHLCKFDLNLEDDCIALENWVKCSTWIWKVHEHGPFKMSDVILMW